MLNITIQNDGKIKIQSEYSNTKEEIVNAAAADKHDDIVLSQSPDGSYIATIGDALESVGCICKIIEK